MLFTSWRNEETNLLKNYSMFEARHDKISKQMQQYAICSEDLNEVGNHLQECDDDVYQYMKDVLIHIQI